MRRRPALVVPALLLTAAAASLTACATDHDTPTALRADVTPSSPASSSLPNPTTGISVVDLLTQTAAGGTVGDAAALPDQAALASYAALFAAPLRADLTATWHRTTPPAGAVLYAAVVAVGCDTPTAVDVTTAPPANLTPITVTARPVPDPKPECLAPMTTIAVLTVPARLL